MPLKLFGFLTFQIVTKQPKKPRQPPSTSLNNFETHRSCSGSLHIEDTIVRSGQCLRPKFSMDRLRAKDQIHTMASLRGKATRRRLLGKNRKTRDFPTRWNTLRNCCLAVDRSRRAIKSLGLAITYIGNPSGSLVHRRLHRWTPSNLQHGFLPP